MKIVLALIMMAVSSSLFAEMVTSPVNGAAISYQVEEGNTVKKGEILYKFYDWWHKNRVEKAKLELKKCKAHLKDKKTDIARANELYKKNAISLAAEEDELVDYYKCMYGVVKTDLELKQLELALDYYTFKAPYDCKVTRNLICVNAGVQYGTAIMEIEQLGSSASAALTDHTMQLTTYIQGDTITFLPKEGQIVKKGETLVEFDTSDLDLQIKALEYSLKEAQELMKDAKTDIDRAKKLHAQKVVSTSEYENAEYLYANGLLAVEMMKLDVAYYKKLSDTYVIPAENNLKVVRRVVSLGSGLKMGNKILEVKKIKNI